MYPTAAQDFDLLSRAVLVTNAANPSVPCGTVWARGGDWVELRGLVGNDTVRLTRAEFVEQGYAAYRPTR